MPLISTMILMVLSLQPAMAVDKMTPTGNLSRESKSAARERAYIRREAKQANEISNKIQQSKLAAKAYARDLENREKAKAQKDAAAIAKARSQMPAKGSFKMPSKNTTSASKESPSSEGRNTRRPPSSRSSSSSSSYSSGPSQIQAGDTSELIFEDEDEKPKKPAPKRR